MLSFSEPGALAVIYQRLSRDPHPGLICGPPDSAGGTRSHTINAIPSVTHDAGLSFGDTVLIQSGGALLASGVNLRDRHPSAIYMDPRSLDGLPG